MLLGVFVLAKAADYWLDRFDLVTSPAALITGMTYTDDHAVLPAKNILMGIAVICAVLFFLNVWRRTWLLPSVGLALLALSAILLGLIWPGIVQQFQVKPSEADKEAPYIEKNIDGDPRGLRPRRRRGRRPTPATPSVGDRPADRAGRADLVDRRWSTRSWCAQTFEQNQQARAYYSVADVLDVDRYEIDGIDRALVLGVRELDQSGINPSDQNWSNLHTVYTHGNGVIAAYANQRPADNTGRADQHPVGRGPADRGRADGAARARRATRPGSTSASRAPTTRSSASRAGAPDVELDLRRDRRARATPRTRPRRTPARAACRSAASSTS